MIKIKLIFVGMSLLLTASVFASVCPIINVNNKIENSCSYLNNAAQSKKNELMNFFKNAQTQALGGFGNVPTFPPVAPGVKANVQTTMPAAVGTRAPAPAVPEKGPARLVP